MTIAGKAVLVIGANRGIEQGHSTKGEKSTTTHKTGTREEWLAARLERLRRVFYIQKGKIRLLTLLHYDSPGKSQSRQAIV
jgi:hypothetical protein